MNAKVVLVIKLQFFCTQEDISIIYVHFEVMWIPRRNQNCVQNMNQAKTLSQQHKLNI